MPPPARCSPHQRREHRLRRRIERGGRLIEQPERPLGTRSAGRATAAAAARPRDSRPAGRRVAETGGRQGVGDALAGPPPRKSRPEGEVFGDRERRLERIQVARIVALLGEREFAVAPIQVKATAARPHQPGDQAQQRRFAGPVRPGEHEGSAGRYRETEIGEDFTPAALTG